jgi:SAM-dependent methyltransferase
MPHFVGWIPTEPIFVEGFFELAPVTETDVVYDLGCGDGRLLFAAIKNGVGKAVGIDIDPKQIAAARKEAKARHVENTVVFIEGDVMDATLSEATVIFCYLIGEASTALKKKFAAELRPGTRVVMETFSIPGWKPVKVLDFGYGPDYGPGNRTLYLYVMPPEITE